MDTKNSNISKTIKQKILGKADEADRHKKELEITRIFDAPRELVWKAWTDPEVFTLWWGPKDFTAPYSMIDLREQGKYLSSMKSPDGKEYWRTGVYKEVVPMEKLVMVDSFADEHGHEVPATYYGLGPEFPMKMLVTVTFENIVGGKTKLTVKNSSVRGISAKDIANMEDGWNQSFFKLSEVLKEMNKAC